MEEQHKPDQTCGSTLPNAFLSLRHSLPIPSTFPPKRLSYSSLKLNFLHIHPPRSLILLQFSQNKDFCPSSSVWSMSTVSKDDNLVLSSEDSSCPEESELELGLGLSLSSPSKSHHHLHAHAHAHAHPPYARIYTAKDFTSSASSSPSSSSSSPNITAGTKRPADSLVANNRPSQVVGWPPLRTYRVNNCNNHAKSTEVFNSGAEKSKSNNAVPRKSADNANDNNINAKEKRHLRSSMFVKVKMDGIPIGRKVDLSVHSSYETLIQTLEDMFNESTTVTTCKVLPPMVLTSLSIGSSGEDHVIIVGGTRHSKLLDGSSKFVLTYEDKEGDWMLVGDVPWGMFLSSVRRLRIMRTSEANGLAPRLEENVRQKCKPV